VKRVHVALCGSLQILGFSHYTSWIIEEPRIKVV